MPIKQHSLQFLQSTDAHFIKVLNFILSNIFTGFYLIIDNYCLQAHQNIHLIGISGILILFV